MRNPQDLDRRSPKPLRVCTAVGEQGAALLIGLLSMTLFMALGLALVLMTGTETAIAGNFRHDIEALYAGDAGFERAMAELARMPDWNPILSGVATSSFVDGSGGGSRTLADGRILDLTEVTNLLNCRKASACSEGEMDATSAERPWGRNNPRWQLYAYGPLANMLGGLASIDSSMYVVVWVADDQMENDDLPLVDGEAPGNPGAGIVSVRAEAFGPGGSRKAIEATLQRFGMPSDAATLPEDGDAGPGAGEAPEEAPGDREGSESDRVGGPWVGILSWRELP